MRRRSKICIDALSKLKMYSDLVPNNLSVTSGNNIHLKALFERPEYRSHQQWMEVNPFIEFFEEYGNRIETLHFLEGTLEQGRHYYNYIDLPPEHFRHLRNVRRLVVEVYPHHVCHYELPEMPSVNELHVIRRSTRMRFDSVWSQGFGRIYNKLPNLRKVSGIPLEYLTSTEFGSPRLTELENPVNLSDDNLYKLMAKKFPLQKLSLTIDLRSGQLQDIVFTEFETYLESIANTLTEFTVTNIPPLHRFGNWYEKPLKNLRRLTINSTIKSLDFVLDFSNLKFLKINCLDSWFGPDTFNLESVHNLESLEISCPYSPAPSDLRVTEYYVDLNSIHAWDFNKIKKAHGLVECDSFMPESCIKNLGGSFPYLKVLKVSHVGDEEVRAIFMELPNLHELALKAGRFTDAGITGISQVLGVPSKNSRPVPSPRGVFLGNLKALTKIELHSENLTDLCFLRGLLECKQLTGLTVIGSTVSVKIVKALVTQLDLRHLEIYLPPSNSNFSNVLTLREARRILYKMRGRTLIMSECLAPSRELTNNKIKRYIAAIRRKHEAFGYIQWPRAIRAYGPYPATTPLVRTDANHTTFMSDLTDRTGTSTWERVLHELVSCSCGRN